MIATVTPNLRTNLESLSNRRENVPLIVVVVCDRTSKINRNKVDGHVQNCLRLQVADMSHIIVPSIACGRTTSRAWLCVKQSHDQ